LVRSFGVKIAGDPVLLFDSQIPWQLGFSMSCLIVTIGLALISWHLYEKHFLKLKTHFIPVQNTMKTQASGLVSGRMAFFESPKWVRLRWRKKG